MPQAAAPVQPRPPVAPRRVPTRLPEPRAFTPVSIPSPEEIGVFVPVRIPEPDEIGIVVK